MERSENQSAFRSVLDASVLGFAGVLILLALVFPSRVPEWRNTVAVLLISGFLFVVAIRIIAACLSGFVATAAYTAVVLSLFSYFFSTVSRFQHVFVEGWLDEILLSWENSLTGTETTLALERFVHPGLTEWMMAAYVLYIPLLPAVAIVSYRADGTNAAMKYLLNLSLANIVCYLGFIVFPVAGPLCYGSSQYTVQLEGGWFTWVGEWIRGNVHYPGGCLPSPHCAATTVMIAMLYRYNRKLLTALFPLMVTIYPATVYGRYHYAADSIAGVLVALIVLKLSPALVRLAARRNDAKQGYVARNVLMSNRLRKEGV